MQRLSNPFALMCALAMIALVIGCASGPSARPSPKTESLLLIAGDESLPWFGWPQFDLING